MKNIIVLLLTAAILVGCMFGVNIVTGPIIEANESSAAFGALLAVMPDAAGFEAVYEAANAASAAQTTANEAKAAAEQNANAIGGLNTTVAGHTGSIADHLARIIVLENADTQHAAEYASLKGTVEGHTSTIATLATQLSLDAVSAKASANETAIKTINETTIPGLNTEIGKKANAVDVYTKSEVGTITEGKTLVEMINDAKSEASYDDSDIKAMKLRGERSEGL